MCFITTKPPVLTTGPSEAKGTFRGTATRHGNGHLACNSVPTATRRAVHSLGRDFAIPTTTYNPAFYGASSQGPATGLYPEPIIFTTSKTPFCFQDISCRAPIYIQVLHETSRFRQKLGMHFSSLPFALHTPPISRIDNTALRRR